MGTTPHQAWFIFLGAAAWVMPGIVGPIFVLPLRKLLGVVFTAAAAMAVWNTAAFYLTGSVQCAPTSPPPGDLAFFILGLLGWAVVPFVVGCAAGATIDLRRGLALSIALSAAAVAALLLVVQGGTCGGPSTQINREGYVFAFPLLALPMAVPAAIGVVLGRWLRQSRGSLGLAA